MILLQMEFLCSYYYYFFSFLLFPLSFSVDFFWYTYYSDMYLKKKKKKIWLIINWQIPTSGLDKRNDFAWSVSAQHILNNVCWKKKMDCTKSMLYKHSIWIGFNPPGGEEKKTWSFFQVKYIYMFWFCILHTMFLKD